VDIVKKAMYLAMTTDATLMGKLWQDPYPGRLPESSKLSKTKGAVTYGGEATSLGHAKWRISITVSIGTQSPDLADSIAKDLKRLFHPLPATRGKWRTLVVTEGQAQIHLEFATDVPDEASELFVHTMRFVVMFTEKP